MGAVVVTMAILLIPGDRKNNAPSGIQDRSCSVPPKIHLASDARPRSLIQQPEDAEPLCHLLPQGRTSVCLCPSVRLGFELSIPPANRHAELDPSIAPPADVTDLPYRRGAVVPEAHRRYLWSLGETRGGLKPAAPPNRPAVFGDDPEGFLSAPPLDSAPT